MFDLSFYTGLYAKGRIKENSIVSSSFFFLAFIGTYILFKLGYSPVVSGWMLLIAQIIIALVVKPIMLVKIVNYRLSDILDVFKSCFLVAIVSVPVPLAFYLIKEEIQLNYYVRELLICVVAIISVVLAVWSIGLDKVTRQKMRSFIREKIKR